MNAAVTSLADKALADLGWPEVLAAWAGRAATARGAQLIRDQPWARDRLHAQTRGEEISEARRLIVTGARLPLGGIADVAGAVIRVRKAAALDAPELVAVAETARSLTRLRAHLRDHAEEVPRLAALGASLVDLGHVYLPILDAFDPDGRLVDHASDALGPLRRALAAITAQLDRRMDGLLTDERFAPYLQDGFYTQRDERYVLPIRTDGKGFVRGIVHGTSGSGQTLFIEPDEIVELNNKKKLAECDVADEERRILARFSGWIAEEADALEVGLGVAADLDRIAAAALLAEELVAAAPILDETPRLALLHVRHPLMLLAGRRCVANDVALAPGATLVISGPNAGGKTVALKAVGLAVVMARAGLHVAAESGTQVGWFEDVRTDVGDAQDLARDLSTFTGHLVNLGEVLAAARPALLFLVDEIAVGTDPDQGAALAQAVLEALADRGASTIVTTHYERLKVLGTTDPRFANAAVGFDLARMAPTFKLHAGQPGSSGALAVARRTGLPEPIVARAQGLLGAGGVRVDELLANLAEQRRRLEEERAAVLLELEDLEADRASERLRRERAGERLAREARTSHGEALAALKVARRELEAARAELRRRAGDAEAVRAQGKRINVAATQVAKHEPQRTLPPGRAPRDGELVVGAAVIVPSLGGRAVVAAPPVRGRVDVQFGAMRAAVDVAEVLIDRHREGGKQAPSPSRQPSPARRDAPTSPDSRPSAANPQPSEPTLVSPDGQLRAGARTTDATIDVRGQRAEEAIVAVDRFLDESLITGRDPVWIIHGHGTGALRTALRAHLTGHAAVARHRAGERAEGGDGVTVAWLKG